MSLITRGLGEESRLVTIGFGASSLPVSKTPVIEVKGKSRPKHPKDTYDNQYPLIDIYTVRAMLLEVNSKPVLSSVSKTVKGTIDREAEFTVKLSEKVKVTKTTPRKNIFIKVLEIFKRQ
jgi:hypothetical protein